MTFIPKKSKREGGGERPAGRRGAPASRRGRERDLEFDHKMIDLRRVARVMAGGRRFNFRAAVVVGDRRGRVGMGLGKGADTSIAIEKAVRQAKKKLVTAPITESGSIPYEVEGKCGSGKVLLRPAVKGKGLVAGSSVRVVLELAGLTNVTAKILSRTKNKVNNALAAVEAIKNIRQNKLARLSNKLPEQQKPEEGAAAAEEK